MIQRQRDTLERVCLIKSFFECLYEGVCTQRVKKKYNIIYKNKTKKTDRSIQNLCDLPSKKKLSSRRISKIIVTKKTESTLFLFFQIIREINFWPYFTKGNKIMYCLIAHWVLDLKLGYIQTSFTFLANSISFTCYFTFF